VLEEQLGTAPRILVWPYGRTNALAMEEAHAAGFTYTLTLNDRLSDIKDLSTLDRVIWYLNPTVPEFAKLLKQQFQPPHHQRIVQVDLDLIYDSDPQQTEVNLGKFLDRLVALKPTTVYLQAFADPDGSGNIRAVYFPNRVLPMRMDLFNRVAHQLKGREIEVYAWMPMLSIAPPDEQERQALRVREWTGAEPAVSTSWYERLSPFAAGTHARLNALYEDLAMNAVIDGVVFQDDGYLNDLEDFHPEALAHYRQMTNGAMRPPRELSDEEQQRWTALKTQALIDLTVELRDTVLRHRPDIRFSRTLYAPVVTQPESETWFAQNYAQSLAAYDYVVVMAYPRLEEVAHVKPWLTSLVQQAKAQPQGLERTIFKVQTYDWDRQRWVDTRQVHHWLRWLAAAGARHLAYYPDNYLRNQPRAEVIRFMMSVEDFPFERH